MAEIKLDFKNSGVTQKSIMEYKAQVEIIHKDLHRRANDEKDFVGWLDLPTNYDKDEFERIKISDSFFIFFAAFFILSNSSLS